MGRPKSFDRNEVLVAAIQVFWKQGYADTSMADLEKATGVNKSGLYSEFKDKKDLFLDCIKYYGENTPSVSILNREPLGWDNIVTLLKASSTCKGRKGCFMANTIREYGIIPNDVKAAIAENQNLIRSLLLKNLKASKTKKDPELLATLIMTFSTGIALKLNAVKAESVESEVDAFIELIKN